MKHVVFMALLLMGWQLSSQAQKISRISFDRSGNIDKISLELDEQVIFNINAAGTLVNWGVDYYLGRQENYSGILHEYAGRVDTYSANDNEVFRGKIKQIGRFLFTYYASYDNEALRGKIKSIGTLNLDYYSSYDNEAFRGLIKTLNNIPITWYSSTDNAALKGKIKTFGPTNFNYYGSFEDKAFQGKVKSIDRFSFVYYSSLDRIEYRGALKTGTPIVIANGIKYYVSN